MARPGPNQTAKIAVKSIGEGKCQIHTRSKIKADDPVLLEATSRSGSSVYLMYPNRNSVDVKTLKSQHKSSTISKLSNFGSLPLHFFQNYKIFENTFEIDTFFENTFEI